MIQIQHLNKISKLTTSPLHAQLQRHSGEKKGTVQAQEVQQRHQQDR